MDTATTESNLLQHKTRNLWLLAAAVLLAMSLWFSASSVVPQLIREWSLTPGQQSWMTMSVQIGFVVGALISAMLTLPDLLPTHLLFAVCALLGAAFNGLIALVAHDPDTALWLRFATGITLAGVYPPGMKLVATWCREDRGFGIGLVVGALTVGSAMPHLLSALAATGGGIPPWRSVLLGASGMAVVAALIALLFVRPGPYLGASARIDWRLAGRSFAYRPTRLANIGYLGHMWELYAMWAWVPIFLLASYKQAGWSEQAARFAGFGVIAIGSAGCIIAGKVADQLGRTRVTTWSLIASGGCALLAGLFFSMPALLTIICLIWGFAVIADSAQFSAAISELSDQRYIGTALTVQTSLGFLLTLFTIRMIPPLVDMVGWRWAFAFLAIGPAFGIWSMQRLRRLPESSAIASGNR